MRRNFMFVGHVLGLQCFVQEELDLDGLKSTTNPSYPKNLHKRP